ncbi:energy transducer TonB [Belliella sp. DSM 111904]|uniref:Energy transducer TonB n=1 Tax=Belliella filtrata TaxID=2923435 RepID=A0ABS9V420_9BACT|nr:energy transducer TonB [Belliella filtrata]MCH7410964.1 energy transducer TonB [Belliella filtrata]
MKLSYLVFLLALFVFQAKSQTVSYLNVGFFPIQDTEKYQPCYYSITQEENGFEKVEIFTLDSVLVMHRQISKDSIGNKLTEIQTEYAYDGWKKSEVSNSYEDNSKLMFIFYENEEVKIIERYIEDELISKLSFDEEGNEIEASEFIQAEPVGGLERLYGYFGANLKYPNLARRKGIEGVVYLCFEVSEEGEIVNLEVMNPEPFPMLADEALRVFYRSPYQWKAGTNDGDPVRTGMRLPIKFKLGR